MYVLCPMQSWGCYLWSVGCRLTSSGSPSRMCRRTNVGLPCEKVQWSIRNSSLGTATRWWSWACHESLPQTAAIWWQEQFCRTVIQAGTIAPSMWCSTYAYEFTASDDIKDINNSMELCSVWVASWVISNTARRSCDRLRNAKRCIRNLIMAGNLT